jgi:hypothetical protein
VSVKTINALFKSRIGAEVDVGSDVGVGVGVNVNVGGALEVMAGGLVEVKEGIKGKGDGVIVRVGVGV